ncbi:uncharacterized protein LOC62_01G001477 [Vanrija pseudolonga]|uniref:Uncharacterized protein n=1 Tax=Vanrija pseudolonga TaxID=143232 RepID=A0AAF1BNC5_9TREE|nr:hypothetical protein LOC62_01G001477 [Vanrija pseudolonga]
MNFEDKSANTVQSLLALLRSTQDEEDASASGSAAPPPRPPQPAAQRPSSYHQHWAPPAATSSSSSGGGVPSSKAISDLLAQLQPDKPEPPSSAFDGPRKGLIDPFGPVASEPADKGKRKASDVAAADDPAEWSFTRCLPVLTELLRDDEFVKEVKKMKADQDALERRLWARMEKVKADHGKKNAAEREVAKITRKPVSADKLAQWQRDLKRTLDDFFTTQVLPATDGLAARQRDRLMELGVPGLGRAPAHTAPGAGEGSAARPIKVGAGASAAERERRALEKERIVRIMGVLEGAVAEH